MSLSLGDSYENSLLLLLFNATAIANIAQNNGTSPLTNLYVALHTADPGTAGNQSTSEVTTTAYTNYARVAVARSSAGWTVQGLSVSPVSTITFPTAPSGMTSTVTATYFSVGTLASGAGVLLFKGAISPSIAITANIAPKLSPIATISGSASLLRGSV